MCVGGGGGADGGGGGGAACKGVKKRLALYSVLAMRHIL